MNNKVTVLMAVYNGAKYLEQAINSILKQTYQDFEFLIIDDGSTDDSAKLIQAYRDERIRFINNEKNIGLASTLNKGIKLSTGEYIARMDQDDLSFSTRIEKQLVYLQKHKDVILLGTGCVEMDREGRMVKQHRYHIKHKYLIKCVERGGSLFPHSSVMYKTEIVKQINGYRNRLNDAEDLDLWMRLSLVGKIGCLSEPLIKLRRHEESITAKSEKWIIVSYGARISHLLRKKGCPDPIEQDDRLCEVFLNWIKEKLVKEKEFQRIQFYLELRKIFYRKDINVIRRSIQLMIGLADFPCKWKFLCKNIVVSTLSEKLTAEWIQLKEQQNDKSYTEPMHY